MKHFKLFLESDENSFMDTVWNKFNDRSVDDGERLKEIITTPNPDFDPNWKYTIIPRVLLYALTVVENFRKNDVDYYANDYGLQLRRKHDTECLKYIFDNFEIDYMELIKNIKKHIKDDSLCTADEMVDLLADFKPEVKTLN